MSSVEIYDTTLRDGAQGEGVSFSLEDKLKITQRLDELGFSYIEGGWPGSNAKDAEFFRRVRDLPLRQARIAAFGATRRAGVSCEADPQIAAAAGGGDPGGHPGGQDVGPARAPGAGDDPGREPGDDRRQRALSAGASAARCSTTPSTSSTASRPTRNMRWRRSGPRYEAGADVVVLCDTNGGSLPWEVERDRPCGAPDLQASQQDGRPALLLGHPHPRRRRPGGGQRPGCRAGRLHPGAGHHQRLRRAGGQLQPVHADPRPAAQDGARLPGRRSAWAG